MSEFSVTHTQRFLTPEDNVDDPQTYEEVSFLVREATIAAGATVEIQLPASYGELSDVALAYDLTLTYPAGLPGLPLLAGNGLTYPAAGAGDAQMQNLCGVVPPAQITATQVNAVNMMIYSVGNYAMDPPENIGYCGLFQNITLQSETGTIIDQSVGGNDFESLMLLKQATATRDELWTIDQSFGTNVFQWTPRLDPLLVPVSNTTGTRRATAVSYSADASTLTVTKSISHPVPLNFGTNYYLPEMGNCKLLLTFNQLSRMGWTAAPRYYTGYMFTETHSAIAPTSAGDDISPGINMDYPIGGWIVVPSGNNTVAAAASTLVPSITDLVITLNSLVLDTKDLASILGDPILCVPHPVLNTPVANSNTKINTYPACGMYQNGITVWMRIANADRDEVVSDIACSPPILRDNWVKRFIPAGLIASIYLGSVGGFSELDLTYPGGATVTDYSLYGTGSSGATVEFIGTQVFIKFCTPLSFTLPIWGSGAHVTKTLQEQMSLNSSTRRFGIEYLVAENLPTGIPKGSSAIPTTSVYSMVPQLVTVTAGPTFAPPVLMASADHLINLTTPEAAGFQLWTAACYNNAMFYAKQIGPELIQPTSIKITNLRLTAKRQILPPETQNFLQETAKSIEGMRITRPVAQTIAYNLQTFDNVELSFQSLPQQVYGFVMGLRNVSASFIDPRFSAYKPFTSFRYAQLLQGSYQTLNIVEGDLAAVQGHHLPVVVPSFPSLGLGLVSYMIKGSGQNPYFMDKWSMLFGNMYGSSEADGTLKIANLAYIQRMGYCKDLVYCLNTLGGAATLDIRTNFIFRFASVSVLEIKQSTSNVASMFATLGAAAALKSCLLGTNPRLWSAICQPATMVGLMPCSNLISTTNSTNVQSQAFSGSISGNVFDDIPLLTTAASNPSVQLYITSFFRKQWVIRHEQGAEQGANVVVWSILS